MRTHHQDAGGTAPLGGDKARGEFTQVGVRKRRRILIQAQPMAVVEIVLPFREREQLKARAVEFAIF